MIKIRTWGLIDHRLPTSVVLDWTRSHQIAYVGSGMKAHVEPSCHLVFSVCGYRRGFIIMWSYSEISAERSQAFWKRINLFFIMADKMAFIFKMAAITDLDLFVILNITALTDFYAFCV